VSSCSKLAWLLKLFRKLGFLERTLGSLKFSTATANILISYKNKKICWQNSKDMFARS